MYMENIALIFSCNIRYLLNVRTLYPEVIAKVLKTLELVSWTMRTNSFMIMI